MTEKTTDNSYNEDVKRVESRTWPGPSKQARHRIIRRVQGEKLQVHHHSAQPLLPQDGSGEGGQLYPQGVGQQ